MMMHAFLIALNFIGCASGLSMPPSFGKGKVVVITGAASGLGKACALKCAERGMKVVLCDIDETDLAATAEACGQIVSCEGVLSKVVDVSDAAAVEALKTTCWEAFGGAHVLLNNAGTGVGSASALTNKEGWRKNLEVNLFGVLNVLQAFVPPMLAQDGETVTIINTGSKQGITMPPGNLAYNVGKAGVKAITEGLQHELRGRDPGSSGAAATAHLFVPGWVNTMLARNYFRDEKGADFDHEKDVPWSTENPAAGAWMPDETIDHLFQEVAAGRFYIICPDNDVSREMDNKRIAWAAGDITERDVPLSRWHTDYTEEFAEYMAASTDGE
mmetsp:Transcript_58081/g.131605  ORF Transcript_58081/g.131605 Transcript_58081/m.131605 type:complete len:329 (+) Transcript_58081:58-1044(+)